MVHSDGQTVLPDRSILKGQKLVENVKIQMRQFGWFSNTVIASDFYRRNIVIRVAWMHFFGRKRLPLQDPNFRENPREDKGKLCPAIMSPLLYWSIVIQFNENKVFLTCTWRQNGFRHMICYSIFSAEVLLLELLSLSQSFWPQVHFSLFLYLLHSTYNYRAKQSKALHISQWTKCTNEKWNLLKSATFTTFWKKPKMSH